MELRIIIRNIILAVLMILQTSVFAQEIKIKLDVTEQGAVVLSEEPGRIRISSSVDLVRISETILLQDTFFRILAEEYTPNYVPGAPELPVRNQLIEYPLNSSPRINIISWREDKIKLSDHEISSRLVPSQLSASKAESPDASPLMLDEAAYMSKEFDFNEAVLFSRLG